MRRKYSKVFRFQTTLINNVSIATRKRARVLLAFFASQHFSASFMQFPADVNGWNVKSESGLGHSNSAVRRNQRNNFMHKSLAFDFAAELTSWKVRKQQKNIRE